MRGAFREGCDLPRARPHPASHPRAQFDFKPLTRVGRKKKGASKGTGLAGGKLPKVVPATRCKLRQMKLERVKDFLLIEREFITNQEVLRPKEEQQKAEQKDMYRVL